MLQNVAGGCNFHHVATRVTKSGGSKMYCVYTTKRIHGSICQDCMRHDCAVTKQELKQLLREW